MKYGANGISGASIVYSKMLKFLTAFRIARLVEVKGEAGEVKIVLIKINALAPPTAPLRP